MSTKPVNQMLSMEGSSGCEAVPCRGIGEIREIRISCELTAGIDVTEAAD